MYLCQMLLFLHQLTHNLTTDCSWNYQFSTWKLQAQNMRRICSLLFMCWSGNLMNNLLSYCGLVDEKDLPVTSFIYRNVTTAPFILSRQANTYVTKIKLWKVLSLKFRQIDAVIFSKHKTRSIFDSFSHLPNRCRQRCALRPSTDELVLHFEHSLYNFGLFRQDLCNLSPMFSNSISPSKKIRQIGIWFFCTNHSNRLKNTLFWQFWRYDKKQKCYQFGFSKTLQFLVNYSANTWIETHIEIDW